MDLVEFLQKHFAVPVDRTRIDEEGDRIAILLRHTPTESRLEIEASPAGAVFRFGGAEWKVDGGGEAGALRAALLAETLGVLQGRTRVLTVPVGEESAATRLLRGGDEEGLAREASVLRASHPGGGPVEARTWGRAAEAL